jgi:hypothetical protein
VLAVWAQKEFAIQFICLLFAGHWLLTAAGELLIFLVGTPPYRLVRHPAYGARNDENSRLASLLAPRPSLFSEPVYQSCPPMYMRAIFIQ